MSAGAEKVVEDIHRELARRKLELTAFKLQVNNETTETGKERQWLLRASVALSYAHWEGFVKSAGRRYIRHVSSLNLSTSALKPGLQALTVLSHFKQAAPSTKTRYLAEILTAMDEKRAKPFSVNAEKSFDTEGNLSSTVLSDLLTCLGFERSHFDNQAGLIDAKIVHSRNQVAHGDLVEFSRHEALERIDGVVALLDEFSELIIQAVSVEQYLIEAST